MLPPFPPRRLSSSRRFCAVRACLLSLRTSVLQWLCLSPPVHGSGSGGDEEAVTEAGEEREEWTTWLLEEEPVVAMIRGRNQRGWRIPRMDVMGAMKRLYGCVREIGF